LSDAEAGLLAAETAECLAALVDLFEDQYANSITLSGGDNLIPGPFLAGGTDPSVIATLNTVTGTTYLPTATLPIGAVDISIHNAIGVVASAIGNHEFDLGSNVLDVAISSGSSNYKGALFPFISANLDFSADSALKDNFVNTTATPGLEEAGNFSRKIVPSAVLTRGGEKIGLVGATTQLLEAISSPSGTEVLGFPTGLGQNGEFDNMDLLASQLQPVIDDLRNQGVNKIVLLTHLQILTNDIQLAPKLSGVDIILAAGSHTRLGDENDVAHSFTGHPPTFAGTYPLVLTGLDGHPTLVVNTDNEYTYLGRLVVDFDAQGNILLDSVTSRTLINGAIASTRENVAAAYGVSLDNLDATAFAPGTRGGNVKALVDAVQGVIDVKGSAVFGYSTVYLEGERSQVRSQQTNLGSLVADAAARIAEEVVGGGAGSPPIVALENGGAIRAQIGTISPPKPDGTVDKLPPLGGAVSLLDIENSLRFNNAMMVFETTPQGIKALLENGLSLGTGQGRFPQVSGLAFSWDPDLPTGSRVRDIALIGGGYHINLYDDGVKLENADVPATILVSASAYISNGGDSYPSKQYGQNFHYVTWNNGVFGLTATVDESLDFVSNLPSDKLGEQALLAHHMQSMYGNLESAFSIADTPESGDTRVQNLNFREEDVLFV